MKKNLFRVAGFLLALAFLFSCRSGDDLGTQSIWTIADHQVDCMGVGPMRCLLVKREGDQDWTMFYSYIEGFDYEQFYEYKILVEEHEIENPPMDASSIRYVLVSILEKKNTRGCCL